MTVISPDIAEAQNNKYAAVLDAIEGIAAGLGHTPGQVATAWVRSKGVFPIIGSRTLKQFEESIAAMTIDLPRSAARVQ